MKKKSAKVVSCLLCLAMLFSMAAPALAAATDEPLYEEVTLTPEEVTSTPDVEHEDDAIAIDAPAAEEDGDLASASELPAEDPVADPFAEAGEYEIYPTPHSAVYGAGTVTLPATMQVTYGEGIDQYTKDRAAEAFQQAGVTLNEGTTSSVKLQVSIKADGDGVTADTANLFDKTSAYKLTIDATGVTVVGVDTDAAFYGLTTMKRILQQVQNRQVKHLTVEDYADVPFRGFIEGYYGNPWTVEDRAALMEFGGELKMNIYFYAPKDDPKHSTKWRELYTQEELETKIRPLAEAGNKSKCYYGFALHPFWAEGINYGNETQYAADLEVLKAKFEQVMSVGVRQIAVLADDRGLPNVASGNTEAQNTRASYVRLMTDLTNWVKSDEMQTKYPGLKTSIPFVPNDYMGNASSAQLQTLKELPDSVPIVQTGGAIWGSVSHSYLSTYRNNMGDKGTFMWINWPCTDQSKSSLIMGAHDTVLRNDLTQDDIDTLRGIMLNPMQQSEPSKAAIFQNADFAWNVWNGEDSAQRIADVWDDCFKYVDHDSAIETPESNALRELAKHMIHNNGSGWRGDWHESAELKDTLAAFRDKLSADTLTAADISAMRTEFVTLHNAAVTFRNKDTGNLRILGQRKSDGTYVDNQEQMAPWLDYWVEFTQANLDLLDALGGMLSNSDGSKDSSIVQHYVSAQSNLTAARSHSFLYMDHYETALAGGEYIAPFTNALMDKVAETAKTIIDPSVLIETVITSRTDTPTGGLEAMRDGSSATEAVFKTPNSIAVGDYVGLKFNRAIPISSVKFEVGTAGNTNDTFDDSKLQYMDDAGSWQDIPGATFSHSDLVLEATGLNLTTKGVRVIATSARTNTWLGIKEITLNGGENNQASGPELATGQLTGSVIRTALWSVYSSNESNLIDGDDSTHVEYDPDGSGNSNSDNSMVGDYIGLDLGRVVKNVGRVRFVVGNGASDNNKWTAFKLQYSTDNASWVDVNSYTSANAKDIIEEDLGGVAARYIRFVNTQQVHKWVRFSELSVWANDSAAIMYQSDAVKKITNPVGELADDKASLAADNVMLRPGEFVGISLPTPRRVTDIIADYTPAPGLVLKVGMNEAELEIISASAWSSRSGAAQLFADDSSVIDYNAPARYVRLENEGEQTISFQLNELSVNSDVIEDIHFVEEMTDMGFDGDYGNQDNRESLNFFDGDMTTETTLAQGQTAGEYVTYDLGQMRSIKKLAIAMKEDLQNYLRHGVLEVSPSGANGTWTTVLTVDNDGEYNSQVKDGAASDPSFKLGVPAQNYASFVGELGEAVQARYLRIRVTENAPASADGNRNFISASEILINTESLNDMEYISTYTDPTIEVDPIEPSADFTPDKLLDGDLTTGFRPNMDGKTSGSLIYRLSDETSIGQISLITSGTAGVKLAIRAAGEPAFREPVTLAGGFDQLTVPEDIANVAEIKLTWGDVTPTFYELITVSRDAVVEGGGQAPSEVETIPINSYSGDARKVNFDENWKFNLGDVSGAETQVFNDSAWRTINLPHDFSIEQEYSSSYEAESAYLPGGTGWYRKSFTIDPSWENKTVSIDFGGAYMDTEVYLNGEKLGEYHYGYTPFSFVLPAEHLNYAGENVIAVKVVNSIPSSRWYSGSGLYRSVHLTVTSPVHVARYGTYVNPVKGSGNNWTVNIKTDVQNDTASAANVTVEQAIYELDSATYEKGAQFAETASAASASPAAGASASVEQTISVQSPKLWNSWDKGTPNLYVLVTTVKQNGTVVDTYETEFGFRTIEFTVNEGFKLNGKNVKLKGVCQHHDQGALGAEAWYRAMERQVEILMEMGCNSIRVTHNPADDGLIEICNRKGILIIDEFFDMWTAYKNSNHNDFARWFNVQIADTNTVFGGAGRTWAQLVVETTVGRDQNSPCVIMYSIGNEITTTITGSSAQYPSIARNIIQWTQAMDSTRPLTMGDNNKNPDNASNTLHQIDQILHEAGGVVGYNYADASTLTKAHNLGWKMYGSETASATNSRGIYDRKASNSNGGHSTQRLTSYDKSCVSWGSIASEAWWRTIRFDYNAGEYVWTGFDYIGEPTPWNSTTGVTGSWPSPKSSYFGIIDTNGIPKDSYYMYRAMWMEDGSTTLHVLPTWDEEDLMLSNGNAEVVVYSNAPIVKVYLNGNEVGTATSTEQRSDGGLYTYRTFTSGTGCYRQNSEDESLYATFNVPYEAGTLEVKAYQADGTTEITDTVGRDVVRTTSAPTKLVAAADRKTIKNDGRDLSYVTIDVVDAKGEIVNGAEPEIKVSVTGDGVFMGLDNGVQDDHTPYHSDTRKAGAGRLVAIIQSTKKEGSFTVTATSTGLSPAAVTVSTGGVTAETGGDTPVSYDLSKTIYVQLNTEPELPQKATVTLGNGSQVEKAITWNEYDKGLLATPGAEFAITGVIADYNIPVSIGVVVLDDVVALLNYSAAVQVGQTPLLPTSRPAVMADGKVVSAQFDVDWDELPENATRKAGKVIVNGTADVFGETYNVTATIRVAVGDVVEGENNSSKADTLTLNGADSQPLQAIRDGDANTSWTGSGDVVFYYNTPLAMSKIKLLYDGVPPASSVMTLYVSPTGMDGSWTPRSIRPTTEGHTVTYNFNGLESAFYIKLAFASEVSLAEAELISGTPVFPIGSTAELDGMNINGQSVSASQLAAKSIRTTAINGVIHPISDHNVAVTILPENKDSQIILVTESENHAERAVYTVQLDAGSNPTAEDDSMDYPYTKTTATAPSEHNHANSSTDGPASEAVDGDLSTYWHSNWGSGNGPTDLSDKPEQRYIQLTLDEVTKLAALRYKPRSGNGTVTQYEVWVSTANNVTAGSKDTFTKVSEGTWANNADWKLALFNAPADAKYVRLYGVHTYGDSGNDKFMSAAEIRLVKAVDTSKIDLSEATITVEPNVFEWKNVGIRPGTGTEGATVTVTLRGRVLTLHEDYELGYENNIDPGTAYIYARAKDGTNYQGAAAATFTIVKTDAKITSFRPVTIPVQPGIDPTESLPKTVMAFTDSTDGLPMEVEVTWDEVPAEWYNFPEEKTRILNGSVDPDLLSDPSLKPTATLKFAYSQSVDSISMVTAVGVLPDLPDTVTVQFDDGTSGQRTVSKWYVKGDADKTALTAADFATEGTVELEGEIVGIRRVKASASVRVAQATSNSTNLAKNDAVRAGATVGSLPLAISWEGCPADNPFNATNGAHPNNTASGKKIWCDWQSGDYNDGDWFGVIFGDGDQVQSKFVNKVKLWFVQESAANGCRPPKSIKIQYYTGPEFDYYTQLSVADESRANKTNGMVSAWGSSHPFASSANWKDVTGASYPASGSYAAGTEYEISFDAVNTKVIRVVFTHQENQWIGLDEMEVYGLTPPDAHADFTAAVTLGGEAVNKSEFTQESAGVYVLNYTLPANSDATKDIPKLAVTATNNASISVVQAVRVPGVPEAGRAWAQAVVTSEDGSKTETYTVKFTRTGAAVGFFIELDEKFPTDKLQLVNASGQPITGGTPNTEITIQVSRGYQAQVWVEITEGDRLGELVTISNNKFLMPAAGVHVYGSAMAITYNIKYLLNGGSFTGDPRVTYNVETATFSVNDPTRPGYTFQGWVGGGLTQPTKGLTITQGSIGDRTYTAVWETNATIGGGGGNNGGSNNNGPSTPVGDVTVTTKNPDGSTTETTTTTGGLVSAVTTAPDGTQSAVIQIPQNSGSSVNAVMPALNVDGENTPQVSVQNNTGRPLSVTVPVSGANTIVAVRQNDDGSETVIPYSIVDEEGLRVKVESGDQILKLIDNKKSFDDVSDDHWAANSVDFVSSRELFNGMGSADTFAPSVAMDRAMLTTVLWRLAEKPDADVVELFSDVQSGSYYEQAVCWAVAGGVIKGTDNGFEPTTPVTREMLAVMLYRAAGSPTVVDEMPRRFTDSDQVAGWAQEAMIWCIQNDIIKGYLDNTLGSQNVATRAEVAAMLQRFVDHQI